MAEIYALTDIHLQKSFLFFYFGLHPRFRRFWVRKGWHVVALSTLNLLLFLFFFPSQTLIISFAQLIVYKGTSLLLRKVCPYIIRLVILMLESFSFYKMSSMLSQTTSIILSLTSSLAIIPHRETIHRSVKLGVTMYDITAFPWIPPSKWAIIFLQLAAAEILQDIFP